MLRIRDITGQVFSRLTVKKLHPDRTKHCKAQWICECTCGKMTVVQGSSLRNGSTKSCGCLRIEYQQAQTDAGKSRNCLNNRNKRKSVCYMKRWMVPLRFLLNVGQFLPLLHPVSFDQQQRRRHCRLYSQFQQIHQLKISIRTQTSLVPFQ